MKPMILLNLEFPVAFQIRGSQSWFDSFEKIHESSRYKSKSQTGGVNEQFRQGISRTDECGSNTYIPLLQKEKGPYFVTVMAALPATETC